MTDTSLDRSRPQPAAIAWLNGEGRWPQFARHALKWLAVYLVILAISAYLGWWTPEYLAGRSLWHFYISRMVVPMVAVAAVAAFVRLVSAGLLVATALLAVGMASAIKREATGEPIQLSDFLLIGQSVHLTGYTDPIRWLAALSFIPAAVYAALSIRPRWWSLPVFAVCAGLLSTYRIEAVANFIHDYALQIGVENLTFSQAESERMNGLATHLYFSSAGLRLHHFDSRDVAQAMDALDYDPDPTPSGAQAAVPAPDLYLVLGEAWWRDPSHKQSPIDALTHAGFAEGTAVSPVYGGTTPNAEFEVLTGIPVKSFQAGIIPYQHYRQYISEEARTLPRILSEHGYTTQAMHNFTRRFWLRDQVYPLLGFARFDGMDEMRIKAPPNGWPKDAALYVHALQRIQNGGPQFQFLVTVETHGPYTPQPQLEGDGHPGVIDYHNRLADAVKSLIAFDKELRARHRPYVLVVFGDHLPGLRLHQWKNGIKDDSDPRLHLPLIAVSSNVRNPAELRDRLAGRPFTCFSPTIADWLGIGIKDRWFRHVASRCKASTTPEIKPSEAVIQNQLFSKQPVL